MKPQEDKDSNMISKSKSLSATQKELVKFAEGLDGVRKVNKSDVVANTLSSVNVLVGYVSIAIILILFGVSIFLISNTVTMGITVRKEEIAIMKYIGAKDFVVRSPFVLEGLIIGIVGAVLPLALLYALYGRAVGICDDKIPDPEKYRGIPAGRRCISLPASNRTSAWSRNRISGKFLYSTQAFESIGEHMKERMKKVTALCLAAALSVGTVLPVHAETVQDAQNAVDQLQQQKDSVQAEKTTVETE